MKIIKATIRMENMRDVPKIIITNVHLLALQKILKVQVLQKNNN